MTFTLLTFLIEVVLILFPGLALHRALAPRLLGLDDEDASSWPIDEVDMLGFGLLPALALANTVGTLLAICHVFYWWSYLAAMVLLVGWRWRDARATLIAVALAARRSWRALVGGNVMVIVAVGAVLQIGAAMLVEAQVPSGNVDVWNHNLPLAQSIVAHHGFVMPQIDNMFYGTYPIFFHMFFAEGLLFVDSVIAAGAANALLYLSFLLSLLAFARHARPVAALLIAISLIGNPFFSSGVAIAMTDIGRVCFSGLAFAFAYQYFRSGRVYFLFASGLLAGGAIAGKYTELLTPMLIGLSLLPALARRTQGAWTAVVVFSAAAIVTGAYPYLRNLILLHNPIYPFLFGHAGLSDAYMQALQAEVFHALDPAFRTYSQNLLTPQGWRDYAIAAHQVFMSQWKPSYYAFAVIGAALVWLRSGALVLFAFWTLGLWIFWFTIGSMNGRWGLTPFMLFVLMAYLAAVASIDRGVELFSGSWPNWRPMTWSGAGEASRRTFAWITPASVARIVVTVWALFIIVDKVRLVRLNGIASAFPPWFNRDLARAIRQPEGLELYLDKNVKGYEIYRYIGDHDLRMVLQPFDNGAGVYQTAYNGGRDGEWLIPWYHLPGQPAEFHEFLRTNQIRYFVHRRSLSPLEVERLASGSSNPHHSEVAYELMGSILPGSRLILTDAFGWELREIAADRLE